jgi:RNA polymerase sigma-70 factor, ECF subfamily
METTSKRTCSEKELIERAMNGDRHAFDELIELHYTRVTRVALRMVRDIHDAEDVAQQTFTAAYQNLDKFRGDSAFTTWLTRIAMNEALTVLRKRKRRFSEFEEEAGREAESALPMFSQERGSPEDDLLKREQVTLVRESLASVKPVYRPAMKLRVLEDMSVEEIADRLSMPVNTVKVHLFRGRQSMKTYLTARMALPEAA